MSAVTFAIGSRSRVQRVGVHFSTLLCLLALGACAEGDPPPTGDGMLSGPLLPWAVGNTWTYRVTADNQVSEKVTTVGALEPVGGTGPNAAVMANKVVTKKGAMDQTISWQAEVGDRVVRYREQSYGAMTGDLQLDEHWDPAKLHIDSSAERTVKGATWFEDYSETKLPTGRTAVTTTERDRWSVEDVGVRVTVPFGTFDDAIVFNRVGGSSSKKYWYVPGVGKVKETGGQIEELERYQLVP